MFFGRGGAASSSFPFRLSRYVYTCARLYVTTTLRLYVITVLRQGFTVERPGLSGSGRAVRLDLCGRGFAAQAERFASIFAAGALRPRPSGSPFMYRFVCCFSVRFGGPGTRKTPHHIPPKISAEPNPTGQAEPNPTGQAEPSRIRPVKPSRAEPNPTGQAEPNPTSHVSHETLLRNNISV